MAVRSPVPPEILRMIFKDLGQSSSSLHELSLTSKLFNLEATRLLYRTVIVDDGTRNYKFLTTIKKKPDLAALVHTYHSPITGHSQKRRFWPLFVHCLSLMTELKELAYRRVWADVKSILPKVKKGNPLPFKLENFAWTAAGPISDTGPYRYVPHVHEIEILEFFESQPTIQSFLWANPILSRTIPETCFTNLKVVEGDIHIIQMLAPTRPSITEIYWRDCRIHELYPPDGLLHRSGMLDKLLGLSMANGESIRFLSCLRDSSLRYITFKLQVLELCVDGFQHSQKIQLADAIPINFPHLKRLCFKCEDPPVLDDVMSDFRKLLHWDSLESNTESGLDCIDFWLGKYSYRRWVRNHPAPEKVTIHDEFRLRLPG